MQAQPIPFPERLREALKNINPANPGLMIQDLSGETRLEKYYSLRKHIGINRYNLAAGFGISSGALVFFAVLGSFFLLSSPVALPIVYFTVASLCAVIGLFFFIRNFNWRQRDLVIKQALFLTLTEEERNKIEKEEVAHYRAFRKMSAIATLLLIGALIVIGLHFSVTMWSILGFSLAGVFLLSTLISTVFLSDATTRNSALETPEAIAEASAILFPASPEPIVAIPTLALAVPAGSLPRREREPLLDRAPNPGANAADNQSERFKERSKLFFGIAGWFQVVGTVLMIIALASSISVLTSIASTLMGVGILFLGVHIYYKCKSQQASPAQVPVISNAPGITGNPETQSLVAAHNTKAKSADLSPAPPLATAEGAVPAGACFTASLS